MVHTRDYHYSFIVFKHWLEEIQYEEIPDELFEEALSGNIDLNDIMASVVHGRRYHGVDPKHLPNTWRIDMYTAKMNLDVTFQGLLRTNKPKLAKKYGTN